MSRTVSAQPRSSAKKMRKGIIAGIAGVALLAGGGASFATWRSEYMQSGEITTGTLSLESTNPTATKWALNDKPQSSLSSVKLVPGDTMTFNDEVKLTAEGTTDMQAVLTPNLGSFSQPQELAPFVDYTVKVSEKNPLPNTRAINFEWKSVGNAPTGVGEMKGMPVTIPNGTDKTLKMTATITFSSTAADAATQGKTIRFEKAGLIVQQTATATGN